jgi:uncharacterized Rmd1/YagE family protein
MRNRRTRVPARRTFAGGRPVLAAHQELNTRLHLNDWSDSIRHNLDVAERTHEMLYSQGTSYRMELLEAVIVLLIVFEIVMAC